MIRTSVRLSVCLLLICCALPLMAQSAPSAESVVPAMVKFSGTLNDADGKPLTGTVGLTFLLYKEQAGGAPLWMETQNVQADKNGHYSVMLGSATSHGMPAEAFTAGEARWLGVQPSGQAEQPRVALVSVPYALKALDAETLGGKPASAFMSAPPAGAVAGAGPRQEGPQLEQKNEIVCSSTTNCKTGFVPLFSSNGGSAQVTASLLSQSGSTVTINGNETVGGSVNATNANVSGQLFVSAQSGNGAAIEASSPSSVATVIYGGATSSTGAVWGVEGEQFSGDPGASGVVGIAHAAGIGVTGRSDATGGVGVLGTASNGVGFYTDSNVQQARTAGGWVKGMVYYSGFNSGRVVSCFNSTLSGAAATTPPCGFSATKVGTGDYILDFGFEIDDRFYSVTNTNWFATTGMCTNWNGACSSGSWTPSQVEVFSFLPEPYYNTYTDTKFYLVVY
jgi:hypothetical protein